MHALRSEPFFPLDGVGGLLTNPRFPRATGTPAPHRKPWSPPVRRRPAGRQWPVAVALLATLASACGSSATADVAWPDVPEFTVTARDFGFDVAPVTAGPVRLQLQNAGMEMHHAQLMQLGEVGEEEFLAALSTGDEGKLLSLGPLVGGTGGVSPGSSSKADGIPILEEGNYAFLCFIEGTDGIPHLAKGMTKVFEVEPADPTQGPAADLGTNLSTIEMFDFAFGLPDTHLEAGVYTVTNSGQDWHEVNILRLLDAANADDVRSFLAEPTGIPPFVGVGGTQALQPGQGSNQLLALDLAPGEYVFLCFVPTAEGIPHFAKGMLTEVTVTG